MDDPQSSREEFLRQASSSENVLWFRHGRIERGRPHESWFDMDMFSKVSMVLLVITLLAFFAELRIKMEGVSFIILGVGSIGLISLYVFDIGRPEGSPGYVERGLVKAAKGATKFWRWPARTAVLCWLAASLLICLVGVRFSWLPLCSNNADSSGDQDRNGCDFYEADLGLACDGRRDTLHFKVAEVCCVCGGGHIYRERQAILLGFVFVVAVALACRALAQAAIALEETVEPTMEPRPTPESMAEPELVVRDVAGGLSPVPEEPAQPGMCVICYAKPANHVLLYCGHMCICGDCLPLFARSRESRTCPLCRQSCSGALPVYNLSN